MKSLLAAALLAPGLVHAQSIGGTVVDRGENAIPGVVVLLIDERNNIVSRSLTSETGSYRVSTREPGRYHLRTMRIGFQPTLSPTIAIGYGQEVEQKIVLSGVTVSLDTVRVTGRSACRVGRSADVTATVWEQIRTALTATTLSGRVRDMSAKIVSFERTLTPDARQVKRDSVVLKQGFNAQPWRSASVDSLRRFGYVVSYDDGSMVYRAPDIEVLASDEFLSDHCFRLARSDDDRLLGIAFEPSVDRKLSDIRGTIWVDKASAELRRLEFRYTGIRREQEDAGAGGEIRFVRAAGGMWAIERWLIRMPVLVSRTIDPRLRAPGAVGSSSLTVGELREVGGRLALLMRRSDTLHAHPPVPLGGIVEDSVTGRPVAGATVAALGTSRTTVADAAGRFRFTQLVPGNYRIEARAPGDSSVVAITDAELLLVPLELRLRGRAP